MPEYLDAHFEFAEDLWDPTDNPDGYIGLCVAENKLVWDLLEPRLTASRAVPQTAVEYDQMIGGRKFRSLLAGFLGARLYGREVSADHLAVLGGAGSVLELLFYVLADPGDGVLVPTPSYAGFWADLETRNRLNILPVNTSPADGFALGSSHLEAAYQKADRPVRALLFTSPSNPLGRVFSRRELEDVLDWAERRSIHVVFDELFALSVFGETSFVSAGSLRPVLGERVHLVWGASKDLAASGLRCGVLISENESVISAVDGLAYWACVSGDTQHFVGELLADDDWLDGFFRENRRRLGHAYERVTRELDATGIPYHPAEAGFFFLLDIRPYLPTTTWEAEDELWRRILTEARVNLTPGSACRVAEPGFMRLCFAGVPPDAAVEGVRRLARILGS